MALCTYADECVFFTDPPTVDPEATAEFHQRFCRNHHSACARYLVQGTYGPAGVPRDLLPDETERAEAQIRPAQIA